MRDRVLYGAAVLAVAFIAFAAGYFSGSDTTQRIVHPEYKGGTAREWAMQNAKANAVVATQKKTITKLLRTSSKAITFTKRCVDGSAEGC